MFDNSVTEEGIDPVFGDNGVIVVGVKCERVRNRAKKETKDAKKQD